MKGDRSCPQQLNPIVLSNGCFLNDTFLSEAYEPFCRKSCTGHWNWVFCAVEHAFLSGE